MSPSERDEMEMRETTAVGTVHVSTAAVASGKLYQKHAVPVIFRHLRITHFCSVYSVERDFGIPGFIFFMLIRHSKMNPSISMPRATLYTEQKWVIRRCQNITGTYVE